MYGRPKRGHKGPIYLTTRDSVPSQLNALPPTEVPDGPQLHSAATQHTEAITGLFQNLRARFFRVEPSTNFENY